MSTLQIIIGSTRKGRAVMPIAEWFFERARQHGKFAVELIDLQTVNLPLLDEPNHPRLRQYQHPHTKAWSATISRGDAYVFITPEYNYGPSPALINALDYLYVEWQYKPAGFVSYGGVSAGLRAAQVTKQVVTALKMMPMFEAVSIPFFSKLIQDGKFNGGETQDKAASAMLDELLKWSDALKVMRSVG